MFVSGRGIEGSHYLVFIFANQTVKDILLIKDTFKQDKQVFFYLSQIVITVYKAIKYLVLIDLIYCIVVGQMSIISYIMLKIDSRPEYSMLKTTGKVFLFCFFVFSFLRDFLFVF